MNFIHNELRNRLTEVKLGVLLMIYLNGEPWQEFKLLKYYV